jgi:hypothetical protein
VKKNAGAGWNTTAFRNTLQELVEKEDELNTLRKPAHLRTWKN